METEKTSFVYVTYIRSTPEKVFEAITRPEIARRYWAHENVSDWKPGSPWKHVRADGAEVGDIVGKVIESTPPRRLVFSWARPADADDAAKHSRVSFDIEPYGEKLVRLTVTHDELEQDPGMLTSISGGWPKVLSNLKTFLETGSALPSTPVAA